MACTACRRSLGQTADDADVRVRCDATSCAAETQAAKVLFLQLKTSIQAAAGALQLAVPDTFSTDPSLLTQADAAFALRVAEAAPSEPSGFRDDLLSAAMLDPGRVHTFLSDNPRAAITSFFNIARWRGRPRSAPSDRGPLFLIASGTALALGVFYALALRSS